jgi:hypothetical protein
MTILYTKRGRRYYPVGEYSPEAMDMLPNGSHLVTVSPGNRIITYQVDPDHAGLLAALQEHENTLIAAIQNASEKRIMQIERRTTTAKERRAIKAYRDIMGPDAMMVIARPSAWHILDGLRRELMTIPIGR